MRVKTLPVSMIAAASLAACSGTPTDAPPTEAPPTLRMEAVFATSLSGIVNHVVDPAPTVRVTDADGRPIDGVFVSFSGDGYANATVRTANGGLASASHWVLGTASKTYSLFASSTGVPDVVFTAAASPGPASKLQHAWGDLQRGNSGQLLPEHLRVRVMDSFSNPIPDVPVTFEVVEGNGTLEFQQALTNLVGVASAGGWTLGHVGGEHRVTARTNGLSFTFTAAGCDAECQQQQLIFADSRGLHRVNVGGVITPFFTGANVSHPAWAPNGARLAFVKVEQGILNTYVMNADGTGVRKIASGMHSPSWSPDNHSLVLASGTCGYDCALVIVDADDPQKAPRALPSNAGSSPAWSPDGQRIAYISLGGDDGYHQLRTVNADGTGDVAVTVRDHGWIPAASWSPNGERLAFSWCHGAQCDIHIANPDGSIRQLTTQGIARGAAWSPDGSKIAIMVPDDYDDYFSHIAFVDAVTGGNVVYLSSGTGPAWIPQAALASVRRD